MPIDLSHINWVLWGVVAVVLAIGWTILRIVLRLTMRMFAMGCVGLILLAGIVFAVAYFSR
jgi:hypothetical protein